jgi:hypothetical protein
MTPESWNNGARRNRPLLDKHVSAATNKKATIEEFLEAVFSMRPVPRLYNVDIMS